MRKHSPGPWKYVPSKNQEHSPSMAGGSEPGMGLVVDANGEEVVLSHCGCCFEGDQHISEADGLLAAEAPEMLELLREDDPRCIREKTMQGQFAEGRCGTCHGCRLAALLARIDKP